MISRTCSTCFWHVTFSRSVLLISTTNPRFWLNCVYSQSTNASCRVSHPSTSSSTLEDDLHASLKHGTCSSATKNASIKCYTHMLDYKTNLSFSADFAVVYSSIGALKWISIREANGATSDKYSFCAVSELFSLFSQRKRNWITSFVLGISIRCSVLGYSGEDFERCMGVCVYKDQHVGKAGD